MRLKKTLSAIIVLSLAAVLAEVLSDAAFDVWYDEFVSGLRTAAGI